MKFETVIILSSPPVTIEEQKRNINKPPIITEQPFPIPISCDDLFPMLPHSRYLLLVLLVVEYETPLIRPYRQHWVSTRPLHPTSLSLRTIQIQLSESVGDEDLPQEYIIEAILNNNNTQTPQIHTKRIQIVSLSLSHSRASTLLFNWSPISFIFFPRLFN